MSVQKLAIIKDMISKNIQTEKNKFDCLMKEIEMFVDGAIAHNMTELKEKANDKKKKGDLFESFCCLYLEKVLLHDQVWFYKDFPKELKEKFHLTKNDYGIDLLSKKNNNYYAIQCKFKKPQDKIQIVSWRSLSTFYAIVVKTGPWLKHITMTNVQGCKHIGEKTQKDWSICVGTFRGMDHFEWLNMSGMFPVAEGGRKLTNDVGRSPESFGTKADQEGSQKQPEMLLNTLTTEERQASTNIEILRNKRVEYYSYVSASALRA